MLENRTRPTRVRSFGYASRIIAPAIAATLALVAGVGPVRSAFPGANGLIAFTSDSNGDGSQLYVMDAIGGAPTQLTTFGNPVENPAWSPDGTRIAFSRAGDLLVIDPDSLAVTPVTDPSTSVEAFEPAWSPDGTMLAFSRRSGADTGIWRINVDGTGLTRLTDRDDRDPAWSPDGGSIAFTRWALAFGEVGSSPGQDIYVMNPDGTGQLRLTGFHDASDPTWSPDGSEIAYLSREPESDIYVLDPNDFGSVLRQVTSDPAYEFGPSWSPDGTGIVFERGRADGSNNDVFRANADGSGQETQLTSGHGDRSPDWQSLSAPAPAQPTCSIGSTRVAEGDTGTPDAAFEVDCTNPTALAASVDYATAPGTAHATTDYTSKTGTLAVAPGDSHLQIRVRAVGDTAPEPHETFTVTLTSSDVVIDHPTATATIADDDGFTLRVETLSVTEGNAGFQDVDLGVTLSHAADQPVRADLVIRSVAALFGVDYDLLTSATVVFDPGDVREVVTFRIYGDVDVEGDQKIEILPIAQLVTDANSLDGGIWIRDDDLATLSIDDVTVPEGASPGTATFTVTRSNVDDDVSVHYGAYDFVDESARAGDDYVANEGLLSFEPGSPTATIEISIIADALDEPDETFGVRLSAPTNATIADDAGVGTITDDDDPPTVSIADSAVAEGDSGTTSMAFKVDLSAPSGRTVMVSYLAADGSASAPDDYGAATGLLTFMPGETSHQVLVGVVGDELDEFDESLGVNLSGPAEATIADGSAEGTILNDDPPPAISINSINVAEGDSGFTQAIFTVSLPAPSGKTVRVAYATTDGTATAVADYMPAASDVVFAPGETAKELPIDIVGEVVIESDETFKVNLSGATNASILDATGTATIENDDEALVPIPHRLASGFGHTCAVTTTGGVRCWGAAGHGALGRGNTNGPLTAAPVVGLSGGVVAVTSGLTHSCALTASGGVKCWGTNDQGQLGDGTTDDHYAPIDVPSLTSGVVDIAAGGDFTCALTSTGGVKCWGFNDAGQLGDGTDERRLTPVDVTGLSAGAVGVTAGWFHACALMGDGSIRCWGADVAGQLGDGTTGVIGVRRTPVRVLGLTGPMTAVTAGLFHTCGLTNAGQALCWGDNDHGQLGDGTTDDSLAPVGVLTMSSGVAEISAGQVATCARTVGGAAKCWGANDLGQLGNDGSPVDSASPVQVTGLASGVTAISAGGTIGCALTTAVAAKCWGAGGNVGDGVVEQRNAPVFIPGYGLVLSIDDAFVFEGQTGTSTTFTVTLAEASANDVTVDFATSDASATAGSDYTAAAGTIAIPAGATSRQITVTIHGDADAEANETFQVALSNATNAAIARGVGTGTIFNDDAEAPELSIREVQVVEGDSGTTDATFTVSVLGSSSHPISVDFATADGTATEPVDYTPASGSLTFAPGETTATIIVGVRGDETDESDETFTVSLSNAIGADITAGIATGTIVDDDLAMSSVPLAAGTHHTCALTAAGGAKCWGSDGYGELGDGSTGIERQTAVDVNGLSGVAALSLGGWFSCALTTSGSVQCWGFNDTGQLGDGTTDPRTTPGVVSGLSSGVRAISAGPGHACALKNAGAVVCWGSNGVGQLGDGTTDPRTTPGLVTGLSGGVVSIGAGYSHSCAVTGSGGVVCWGWNPAGELGDGTTDQHLTPVPVMGLSSGVVAVAAGSHHTCALTTSGGVDCWGGNSVGQLGRVTNERFVSTPAPVPGLTSGFVALAAGADHTCALKSTGEVMCWGSNEYGQLGDGTHYVRFSPTQVSGLVGATAIAANYLHTCAREGDGVKCWGWNGYGQLGNGGIYGDLGPTDVLGFGSDLSIDDVTLTEGNATTTTATFTVSLSVPSGRTITVDYATVDGSAVAGSDYASRSGTLVFLPGQTSRQVTVDVVGDTVVEADETFDVSLSNATAPIADPTGTATITNDDTDIRVSIGDATVIEGNSGTTPATVTVSLSAASAQPITVAYATADGTALAPGDYITSTGTLTFPPGTTSQALPLRVVGDVLDELDEGFEVRLSSPTNASIADGSGAVTISDDDAPPSLRINDVSVVEGDTGTTVMTFTVALSAASGKTVSVAYATASGSAVSPADFTAVSATVTFAPGVTSRPIPVSIRGETVDEANETFSVTLSNAVAASIADASGVGTIVDDDPKPVITSFSPGSLPQGDTLTIRGTNLLGTREVAFTRFGGGTVLAIAFRVLSDTRVTATVPAGATTGRVSIITANGSGTGPVDLLIEPRVLGFSPSAGPVGTSVTIVGSGFSGATIVRFGGVPATQFGVTSDSRIIAIVPTGARTGRIMVVTPGGNDRSMNDFRVR